ncbi:MAG: HSP20 family protein [Myxococcota bacterium]|jgi:HSP20 family protein
MSTNTQPMMTLKPSVDVFVSDASFRLIADFPGVQPEDFDVRLDGETLILEGTRKLEDVTPARYFRSFKVARGTVEPEGLQARLEQGVLTLDLPRSATSRVRSVPVEVV